MSPDTIAEGESATVTVSTGGVTFADDQTITLTLSGSATEGAANDYTIASASIAITAGATSGTATITALDDTEVEDAETIDIAASHGSVEIGSATVTISANDQTAFTLAVSPDTIAEGESATVTVGTGGVTFADDQTITLTLSGSATEGAANDYTIAPASIAISAGATSGTATITALDDTEVEDAETITVSAEHDTTAIGTRNVTISANDQPTWDLQVSPDTIAEGESATVTVSTGGVTFADDQTITLTLSGSATEGATNDYTIAPASIAITAGATSGTATITALDDTEVEDAETIDIAASHGSVELGSATVTISANDPPAWKVAVSADIIAEGESATVTVSTGGVTFAADQTITLTLSGSATEGAANDYTIAPASIAITAGATSGTATITALDDTEVEDAETITVTAEHGSVRAIGSATVTISANDQPTWDLQVSPDTIAEGESATVTVSTGGVTFADDQTITLTLSGSATEGAANDYTIAPASIAISAGAMSGTATITALDDTEVEDAETITVSAEHDSDGDRHPQRHDLGQRPADLGSAGVPGHHRRGGERDGDGEHGRGDLRGRSDDHPHAERQRHRGCGERLHDCAGEHRHHRRSDVGDGDDHGAGRHRGGRRRDHRHRGQSRQRRDWQRDGHDLGQRPDGVHPGGVPGHHRRGGERDGDGEHGRGDLRG